MNDERPVHTSADRGDRRVLVTGAAGFVGSHLAEALLADGAEVVGLDCFTPAYPRGDKERNLRTLRRHTKFRFIEADLRTDALERHLEDIDIVVNEAAMAGLPLSWTDVDTYVGCNITGLARLIDASRAVGIRRFVQISTSSVYGVDARGDETQPTRPVSPYGVSKLAAEQLVLAHVDVHDFPATILRYFSIYGPRQRPDMAYHIFIERLRRGEPLRVFGDGRQSRSNTFVEDCIVGTMAAIEEAAIGEIYNIGGGVDLELLEAIAIIADELGVRPDVRFEPARPGDQRHTSADVSKAAERFGFRATSDPEEGLRQQVAWHLAAMPAAIGAAELVPS